MFNNAFREQVNDFKGFYFNETIDLCSESDFITFLHCLIGCKNSDCVKIEFPETCASLLYVSFLM